MSAESPRLSMLGTLAWGSYEDAREALHFAVEEAERTHKAFTVAGIPSRWNVRAEELKAALRLLPQLPGEG
jgi:hypothetical protein